MPLEIASEFGCVVAAVGAFILCETAMLGLLLGAVGLAGATAVVASWLDAAGVARRCYAWTDAKSDVCFTQRPATAPYDATFSVADMEAMIWGAHKVLITGPTASDKYNDNHYAVDIQVDLGYIAKYFDTNYAKSFPISYPYTQWAWDCDQNYLIDPTGWAIQSDAQFSTQLPGCEDFKRRKAMEN